MQVKVKVVFFDDNGVHKVGDVVEVKNFDETRMERIEEPKTTTRKTTKK